MFKCYENSTIFDAQNAGNCISELCYISNFSGGKEIPPEPPRGKGLYSPFSGHSCL